MKKILITSLLIVFILNFCGAIEKRTIISGKLEGCDIQNVVMFNRYDKYFNETTDSLGRFEFRSDDGFSGYYTIRIGSERFKIYIERGDSCYLYKNCDSDNINFSGTNMKINNYLFKKDSIINNYIYNTQTFADYNKSIDSLKLILLDYNENAVDEEIRNSFLEIDKLETECNSMNNLIEGSFYFNSKISDSLITIHDINNVKFYKKSSEYRKFVMEYLFFKASAKTDKNKLILRYETALELLENGEIKDFVLTDFLESILKVCSDDEYNFSELFETYKEHCSNEKEVGYIEKIYEAKKILAKGNKLPLISLTNNDGEVIELSSFNGTYVYMFIYSPNCGSCKNEIEDFKLIQSLYEDQNIEFIGIAFGTSFDGWQQFIHDNGMIGMQLLAQGKQQGELIQKLMIKYPPTFILIDENQNIVNMRAPKPSDGLEEFLDVIFK